MNEGRSSTWAGKTLSTTSAAHTRSTGAHLSKTLAQRQGTLPNKGQMRNVMSQEVRRTSLMFTTPPPPTHTHTAQTDGGAAARRDVEKTSQYRRFGPGCYHFVPLTVETYGRLGKPLMKLITDVGASAAQQGDDTFMRDQFITGVLRELSVCLCRRNANIERAVSGCFSSHC
jgi:hypothetical protein